MRGILGATPYTAPEVPLSPRFTVAHHAKTDSRYVFLGRIGAPVAQP